MNAFPRDFQKLIEERREALKLEAEARCSNWFVSDPPGKFLFRTYAPEVRSKEGVAGSTISIAWKWRKPINGGQGKKIRTKGGTEKILRFSNEQVRARLGNVTYPPTAFPRASEDELREIMDLEASLAPIRTELKMLGALRRQVLLFYRGTAADEPMEEIKPVRFDSGPDFPEIGVKAHW